MSHTLEAERGFMAVAIGMLLIANAEPSQILSAFTAGHARNTARKAELTRDFKYECNPLSVEIRRLSTVQYRASHVLSPNDHLELTYTVLHCEFGLYQSQRT